MFLKLRQFLICHLGPPWPTPSIMLYITCCSDCITRMLHLSKPVKHSLCPNKVEVLKLMLLDIIVATSSGLILQICLIMAPSLHCKLLSFGFVKGQFSLARSMSFCTQKLYTRSIANLGFKKPTLSTDMVFSGTPNNCGYCWECILFKLQSQCSRCNIKTHMNRSIFFFF